jgi:hypothetical protein
MIKKLMLLATMAMVVSGFVASMAQATLGLTWTVGASHIAPGTNATFIAEGKAKFSNVTLGGTECPVKAEVQLTGGSSTAHVTEFAVTSTAECVLNGPLATSCVKLTEHDVTGAVPSTGLSNGTTLNTANPGGAWKVTGTLNAGVASLDVLSEIQIHNTYEPKGGEAGLVCPKKVTLESTATAKPMITFDKAKEATKAILGGTLTATNSELELPKNHLGAVNITGTLTITPGTYGIT